MSLDLLIAAATLIGAAALARALLRIARATPPPPVRSPEHVGSCPFCKYDLAGLPDDDGLCTCPECGEFVSLHTLKPPPDPCSRDLRLAYVCAVAAFSIALPLLIDLLWFGVSCMRGHSIEGMVRFWRGVSISSDHEMPPRFAVCLFLFIPSLAGIADTGAMGRVARFWLIVLIPTGFTIAWGIGTLFSFSQNRWWCGPLDASGDPRYWLAAFFMFSLLSLHLARRSLRPRSSPSVIQ